MTVSTMEFGLVHATTVDWIDPSGRARKTIVAKTTYALEPVTAPLMSPIALNEVDNHWNDDAARSVQAPSDFAPFKPSAEVTLVGRVFSPGGAPVSSLVARLVVGEVDKSIEVMGDRFVTQDGSITSPVPFRHMSLRYERAAGGPTTTNPVGLAGDPDTLGRRALPNLLPLGVSEGDERSVPVGFGPIAPAWPEREARRERGLAAYHLSSPLDQRLAQLRADERLVLENLHPEHARLVTNLEPVVVVAYIERHNDAPVELSLAPDSLWIDTDRGVATLTWRRVLDEDLAMKRVLVSVQGPTGLPRTAGELGILHANETADGSQGRGQALPFTNGVAELHRPASPESPRATNGASRLQTMAMESPQRPDTLPFKQASPRPSFVSEPSVPFSASTPPSPPPVLARPEAIVHSNHGDKPSPWAIGGMGAAIDPPRHVETPAPISPRTSSSIPPAPIAAPAATPQRPAIELLYCDAAAAPRVRRAFATVLEGIEVDPEEVADDDPRLDATDILVHGEPSTESRVLEAMETTMRARGRFQAPIVLVAGSLSFRFSDQDWLRSLCELASPLATDKRLREALDEGKRAADGAVYASSPALEATLARVRGAIAVSVRPESVDHLNRAAERVMLEARQIQKRTVFGAEQLRCTLSFGQSTAPLYLPSSIATTLPELSELPVRALAEAQLPQEAGDASGFALKVVALGRVIPAGRLRAPT